MQIILLSRKRGELCCVEISRGAISIALAAALVASGGLIYAGMRWGADLMLDEMYANSGSNQPYWQREITGQRSQLAQLRADTDMNFNALALKLGEMQARVTRLDALGERLTGMAKLVDGEFDFRAAPPVGGPTSHPTASADLHDIVEVFDKLSQSIEDRSEKLAALESLLMNRKLQDEIFPTGIPLIGGWMSSGFGWRTDPVSGRKEFHRGIDFTGAFGSDVVAMAAGVVHWSGWREEYGNVVEINHGNGYITRYSHNRKNLVAIGDKVSKGQAIAIMGETGRTTGAHVHFEVLQDGKIVNPLKYIQAAEGSSKEEKVAKAEAAGK